MRKQTIFLLTILLLSISLLIISRMLPLFHLRLAALLGHTMSQRQLGYACFHGNGVSKDIAEAVSCLPEPGAHTLEIVGADGRPAHAVRFSVRGRLTRPFSATGTRRD